MSNVLFDARQHTPQQGAGVGAAGSALGGGSLGDLILGAAKGGKVRLLKKEELQTDWNPATDERLTVWEATHHLIRSLDSGEAVAAALLKQLGAMAEVARDLSYRLYTVCERRKWSQDAIGYNALVLSWPDLKRQADEQKDLGPAQRDLI
jgi:putative DNA methylase